jgi:RNA polymerase sigma-70 factor (ECF subfamily)
MMEIDTGRVSLSRESTAIFEAAFKQHFKALHAYAYTIIKDDMMAEEVVQNMFYKIWKNRDSIEINQSFTAYLYRSVYNDSLNHLKHVKVKAAYQSYAAQNMSNSNNAVEQMRVRDLEQKLDEAMRELPEQCRTIFQLSRFEELKYLQIADKLGISVKTVENQMGKALRLLRTKLVDFLPNALIILLLTL